VRVSQPAACAAAGGSVRRKTFDGALELYQCSVVLQPGGLAAACLHEAWPPAAAAGAAAGGKGGAGSGAAQQQQQQEEEGEVAGVPHLWLFCPDPMCMESRPTGSRLPAW
jgi:hypothetical protein